MAATVLTPIGTLYFPALFSPKRNRDNPAQGARFSLVLLFDSVGVKTPAYAELRRAATQAIADKWGSTRAADASFLRTLRSPFRPAAEKTYRGFENGEVFISAWSHGEGDRAHRPDVVDLANQRIIDPSAVWSGQLARATVRPFAYENQGNRGVSFGLEHVQIVKADMVRLDGRRSGDTAFVDADNSQLQVLGIEPELATASGEPDDEIPF